MDGDPPGRPLERLTIVQIDAHADLREDLDGERHSHACAAARALGAGATDLLQVGIRAFSMEEHERIESDARISTWFARDLFAPSSNGAGWRSWLEALKAVEGPVHLTIDVDGLCPSLVPGTGTPVPGDWRTGMLSRRSKPSSVHHEPMSSPLTSTRSHRKPTGC